MVSIPGAPPAPRPFGTSPQLRWGGRFWTDAEAAKIVGSDRESGQRDLFDAIERGDFPRWRMCVQVMPEKDAAGYRYNPFDLTKVWPHADYPLIDVGTLELNRNPQNYFAEVEQAAFTRPTSCRASASRPTRCCRAGSSPTATRIATGWASTTIRFR